MKRTYNVHVKELIAETGFGQFLKYFYKHFSVESTVE